MALPSSIRTGWNRAMPASDSAGITDSRHAARSAYEYEYEPPLLSDTVADLSLPSGRNFACAAHFAFASAAIDSLRVIILDSFSPLCCHGAAIGHCSAGLGVWDPGPVLS